MRQKWEGEGHNHLRDTSSITLLSRRICIVFETVSRTSLKKQTPLVFVRISMTVRWATALFSTPLLPPCVLCLGRLLPANGGERKEGRHTWALDNKESEEDTSQLKEKKLILIAGKCHIDNIAPSFTVAHV